jgi:hypothetical protein
MCSAASSPLSSGLASESASFPREGNAERTSRDKGERCGFSLVPYECVPPARRAGPPLVCRDTRPLSEATYNLSCTAVGVRRKSPGLRYRGPPRSPLYRRYLRENASRQSRCSIPAKCGNLQPLRLCSLARQETDSSCQDPYMDLSMDPSCDDPYMGL